MRRSIIRVGIVLVVVEVLYLAIVNIGLNLPTTQDYLNSFRPERFAYRWDRAWSWHPFRIHAIGFTANGQTRGQQWQLAAPAISASIAISPLFAKTFQLYNIDSADADIRVRPRPRADRDPALARYYPEIEGRDPNLPAETGIVQQTPGWKLVFDVSSLGGQNNVWVAQYKAVLAGQGQATIIHQGRHGPLTITGGAIDTAIKSLSVKDEQVSESGALKGTFAFDAFLPQENRGLKSLAFLTTEVDLNLPIADADFLDDYLRMVSGMVVGGKGAVQGHISYAKGDLTAGTKLSISADALRVDQAPYSASGAGAVGITVDAASDTMKADFNFHTLTFVHEPEQQTLFSGANLDIGVERSPHVLPGGKEESVPRRVTAVLPKVTVPDLSDYQRYIPDKWNIQLLAGEGSVSGRADISAAALDLDLLLNSERAKIGFKDDAFETDLIMGIKAKGRVSDSAADVDISGTYLELDDSKLQKASGAGSDPWRTRLVINKGDGTVAVPEATETTKTIPGFWRLFKERDMKGLLSTADGRVQAGLFVSDLDWVNILIKNPYALTIHNSADVTADLNIQSGFLAEGSTVKMPSRDFRVEFLDYIAEGSGGFDMEVESGGEQPDIRLDINLSGASLRLQDEKKAVVDQMTLAVTARANDVGVKQGGSVTQLDVKIPKANVTDMAAYNVYVPKGSPLRILSGKAGFHADIKVRDDNPHGSIKMQTGRVAIDIDGQQVSGTVAADIAIKGGSAKNRTFDISGSSISIDGVRVAGDHATNGNWTSQLAIGKGSVVWKRPISMDLSTSIHMTDTRPLLSIFESERKTQKWLDKILTLKDVRGTATVKTKPDQFIVPYAFFKSDTIDVGVKGSIRDKDRMGLFYARYGKLAGILAFDNKKKKFGLIGATKKFDEYIAGTPVPGIEETAGAPAEAEKKKSPFSIFKRK